MFGDRSDGNRHRYRAAGTHFDVLRFDDSDKASQSAGMKSLEVMVYIGENPSRAPKQYRLATVASRTPAVITFDAEDGGKTANYLLRWLNTTDEPGPWSQVISATIPAV